jgi:hypothetical protein
VSHRAEDIADRTPYAGEKIGLANSSACLPHGGWANRWLVTTPHARDGIPLDGTAWAVEFENGEIAGLTASVLGYVDQYFSDCAVLNSLMRLGCVCQREPVQRQADVLAYG